MEGNKRKVDQITGGSGEETSLNSTDSILSSDENVQKWIENLYVEIVTAAYRVGNFSLITKGCGKSGPLNSEEWAHATSLYKKIYVDQVLIDGRTPIEERDNNPTFLEAMLKDPHYVGTLLKLVNLVSEVVFRSEDESIKVVFDERKLRLEAASYKHWKSSDFSDVTALSKVASFFVKKQYYSGLRMLYPSLLRRVILEETALRKEEIAGWERRYEDFGVKKALFARLLRSTLANKNNSSDDKDTPKYANMLPIIQASGCGKSRLLKEIVNTIPGVYVSLSDDPTTIPRGDSELSVWLKKKLDKNSDKPTTAYVCLLHGIFMEGVEAVLDSHEKWKANLPPKQAEGSKSRASKREKIEPRMKQEELARKVQASIDSSGAIDTPGATFFPVRTKRRMNHMEAMVNRAEELFQKLDQEKNWVEESIKGMKSERRKEFNQCFLEHIYKHWNEKLNAIKALKLHNCPEIQSLMDDVESTGIFSPFGAQFIIAVDELTELSIAPDSAEVHVNITHRTAMERAFSLFSNLDVWICYTSSYPDTDFKPHSDHSSSRIRSGACCLPKPFCALPFHVGARQMMRDPKKRSILCQKPMAEFAEIPHLTLYGRSMWQDYSEEPEKDFYKILLRRLLHNNRNVPDPWNPDLADPCQVFALVAARAVLDPIIGPQVSMKYLKDTVVKHLYPVKEFDPELGVIEVGHYMDPALASAVTWALWNAEPQSATGLWPGVIRSLSSRLLDFPIRDLKGERGELFVRLIFLIARDLAWKKQKEMRQAETGEEQSKSFANNTHLVSGPVPLTLFLEMLLPANEWESIQSRAIKVARGVDKNGNLKFIKDTIGSTLKDAHINFTSFMVTEKDLEPARMKSLLHLSLLQNAALICKAGQEDWDLLIPYYGGSLTDEFDSSRISVIAIQVKNRVGSNAEFFSDFGKMEAAASVTKSGRDILDGHSWASYFTDLDLDTLPFIAILSEAGRGPKARKHVISTSEKESACVLSCVFGLRLIGSSGKTYGPIEKDDGLASAFRSLLGNVMFAGVSEYEEKVAAGNILFDAAGYCDF